MLLENAGKDVAPASHVCAVLAHPDDEIFIAGALQRHAQAGATLSGIWITSGDGRGGRDRREAELHLAMDLLGLARENRHLPRFPNRGLLPLVLQAAQWLDDAFRRLHPDLIYVPAYEGGHIEHDVLNRITHWAWLRRCPEAACFEFPLYNRTGPALMRGWRVNDFPPERENVRHIPLRREQLCRKFSLMRVYRSQWVDMLPFRLLMPGGKYLRRGEPCAPLPLERDYSMPPHSGTLNYERNPGTQTFADFAAACNELRVAAP